MVGVEAADQLGDPVAQLQREVGGGGAHQLADVLHSHGTVRPEAGGMLGFAHDAGWDDPPEPLTGTISSSESIRDWSASEIAPWSPISQPWL